MAQARDHDIVVYGATGFTGRLVAEHLARIGAQGWAMAGRSQDKLAQVRSEVGAPADTPLLIADASDPSSLDALAASARVVITTVGPYQSYGTDLVAACVRAGTDYVDLCGEPDWMAEMIAAHDAPARASGARIVFSCGFDSIPFDLGVWLVQDTAIQRYGAPLRRIKGRVEEMKGTFSGGTAASLLETVKAAAKDPGLRKRLANPFLLTPSGSGPLQPTAHAAYDPAVESWVAPFIMAAINTKNVHRTNALLDDHYGAEFLYDEQIMTGDGPAGAARAKSTAQREAVTPILLALPPTRALLRTFLLPKPGQGPSLEQRETGRFSVVFVGDDPAHPEREVRVRVTGDRDPGYGSTSKMISAAARTLLEPDLTTPGGVWTPGAAMAAPLIVRLRAEAGMTLDVVDAQS